MKILPYFSIMRWPVPNSWELSRWSNKGEYGIFIGMPWGSLSFGVLVK